MQKEKRKQQIVYGDASVIAKMTGYSVSYVQQVLDPTNVRTNKLIEDTAHKMVEMRRQIAAGIEPYNLNVA